MNEFYEILIVILIYMVGFLSILLAVRFKIMPSECLIPRAIFWPATWLIELTDIINPWLSKGIYFIAGAEKEWME